VTSREQMYRVFRCPHCGYTGYATVYSEDEDSKCNLCSRIIRHSPDWRYVDSVEGALLAIQRIVWRKPTAHRSKPRHGLGVKKRVLNIVSDLSDLNRGTGVNRDRVLQECKEAGIEIDMAERFLDQLEEEELIVSIDGVLKAVGEDY
jgi:hypothetical protein